MGAMRNVVSMQKSWTALAVILWSSVADADTAAGLAGVQASGSFTDPAAALASVTSLSGDPTQQAQRPLPSMASAPQGAPVRVAMLGDGRPTMETPRFIRPSTAPSSDPQRPPMRTSLMIFILTTLVGYQLHRRHRFLKPRGFSGL